MLTTVSQIAPNVAFGTSGVRALVSDLSPVAVWAYTQAFVAHLRKSQQLPTPTCVVGWDLRPSSLGIAAAVGAALVEQGIHVEWAGPVPTPALALRCLALQCPGIMVTGSHIPFDRNGIKFYTPAGEILKADESAIASMALPAPPAQAELQARIAQSSSAAQASLGLPSQALLAYQQRYQQLMPATALQGLRVGVYQHSAVGRDFLAQLLQMLGATVVALGRSDQFVPIDTEAVSPQDEAQAALWCQTHQLNAVVSTDGDGDRPWVCDEQGRFVRGDILCTLLAQWLGASHVVTPVSSNTAVELSGRIQGVATAASQAFIAHLSQDAAALAGFTAFTGSTPEQINHTDGLRIGLAKGDVLHLRPSGNAPELRCYTESATPEQAQALLNQALTQLQQALH